MIFSKGEQDLSSVRAEAVVPAAPGAAGLASAGHLARFILDVVDELNLSAIVGRYEREERGYPLYHPKMRVALLLYAYSVGAPSARGR